MHPLDSGSKPWRAFELGSAMFVPDMETDENRLEAGSSPSLPLLLEEAGEQYPLFSGETSSGPVNILLDKRG